MDKCNAFLGENKVSGPSYNGRALAAICFKHPDLTEKNNGKGDKKKTMREIIEAQMDHYSPFAQSCQASRRGEADAARAQRASGTAGKRSRAPAASEDRIESQETAGGPASIQISFCTI